jgi:transposase InsO family protein
MLRFRRHRRLVDERLSLAERRALLVAIHAWPPLRLIITPTAAVSTRAQTSGVLERRGIVASMSRKANCSDVAVAESSFATLKVKVVRDVDFLTRESARQEFPISRLSRPHSDPRIVFVRCNARAVEPH